MSILSNTTNVLGQAGSLPKKIEDVTENISKGAQSIDKMVDKADNALKNAETHNPVSSFIVGGLSKVTGGVNKLTDKAVDAAGKLEEVGKELSEAFEPISTAANSIKQSVQDLQNCLDVVKTSSLLVDAVVDSCTGDFNAKTMASALSQFDSGWDSWAKAINGIYSQLLPTGQANILENLAKENFGDNVFNLGSAIKNESSGIFSGIANFESSIDVFGDSYRNPIAAAKKIETGVKGIVNATEKVANSVNSMLTKFALNGEGSGNKVLSYLGNLHNTEAVAALNRVLTAGGSAATMTSDVNNFTTAWKNKDLKGMYDSGKKTFNDAKAIINSFKDKATAAKITTASTNATNATNAASQNNSDSDSSGGSDSYVCSGATIKCTFGEKSVKLAVYPDRTVFLTGQPTANITDHVSMYNIPSFGKCRTTSYPPTGSATAANMGSLTPMPCVPGTNSDWQNGKDDYIIKGNPALLKSSYCQCCYGGIITITDDGQK